MLVVRSALFAMYLVGAPLVALFAAPPAAAEDHVYGVEIAPNGKHYVVLRDLGEQLAFAIYDVGNAAAKPTVIGLGAVKVEDFEWGGDDYLLLRVEGKKGGIDTTEGLKTLTVARWMSISIQAGEMKTLFSNETGADYYYFITSAGQLLSSLPLENEQALFGRSTVTVTEAGPSRLNKSDDIVEYAVKRANLKSGNARKVASGNANTIDWVVDSVGTVIARIDQKEQSDRIEIFAAQENGKQFNKAGEISCEQSKTEEIEFLGAGSSPRSIQVAMKKPAGLQLIEFNLDTGVFSDPIFSPTTGQINSIPYDPRTARARIIYYVDDRERAYHLEESDRKLQSSLEKAIPGAAVSIVSKAVDGSRLIARAAYAGRGDEFYFFDKAAKKLELVAAN